MARRIINVRTLPGESLDGGGRVCIHLFVADDSGRFVEPHALHPVVEDGEVQKQKLAARPTRGRLACDRKRTTAPVTKGAVTTVTHRTDDPRAVTCPGCIASPEYSELMESLTNRG